MKIGIPRALIYWKRPYFWETFFENLDFKTLLSPLTNKEIVDEGVKGSDADTCFSEKVYLGHILWLNNKVDYIFVPRLKTVRWSTSLQSDFGEELEYCPKFFALPDLAKILVETPILTETFDERKEKFEKTLTKLGKKLNKTKEEVKVAHNLALFKENEEKEKERQSFFEKMQSEKPKVLLVSHPYNLYDSYVNLGAKQKLEKLGVEVIFIDQIPANLGQAQLTGPKWHWEFGKEIMSGVEASLRYNIIGAIEISAFQCGSDSVLKEFVEKRLKQSKIPFLYLLIDEQTGEAGLQTRLEAFLDTLKLKI